MEECKVRARYAGLEFDAESLEYIVTNQDMLELSPKGMIPTMYDYWVNDLETIKGKGQYKLYPHNPYETVINTRPAISFYNDNNPDWLNIMIFYHVIGHIDFFQNNLLFKNTWHDDFAGQALADKRLIEQLRSKHGRWVDYVIEFSRSIDNIVNYFDVLQEAEYPTEMDPGQKLEYYFDEFLQKEVNVSSKIYYDDVEKYNELLKQNEIVAEQIFFSEIKKKYPEFESKFEKYFESKKEKKQDLMQFIRDNSPFLKKSENEWMRSVMNIIRNTSLYFSPQIRTKICNEGWASYWHDELFKKDERIAGHEVAYARVNASVTSIQRVGLNPYAIGLRLIEYIEDLANKGKIDWRFQKLINMEDREKYNTSTGRGRKAIFEIRNNFSDFMLINTFVDQDFIDKHNLFVVGKRINKQRGTYEYYVKSRKAEDYKQMLLDSLYHPPYIKVNEEKTNDEKLYLEHVFEGKQLYKDFIPDTVMGISYLWGGQVQLETTEILEKKTKNEGEDSYDYRKVVYTMKDMKISKRNL
jgi:stage V sporulation protein R